jgi:hypothetical protein
MFEPNISDYGIVSTEDVFIAEEYVPDEEGTLFYGEEVAFGEYRNGETMADDDIYEPDVFEYDD